MNKKSCSIKFLFFVCIFLGLFIDARKKPAEEVFSESRVDLPLQEKRSNLDLSFPDKILAPAKEVLPSAIRSNPLAAFLRPWENGDPDELVAFDFEEAELSALIKYVEERYNIICILDETITPLPQGAKSIAGMKISFVTNSPLPKKDAWALFVNFLEMSGLSIVPGPGPAGKTFRITASDSRAQPFNANKEALPTFVGVNPKFLPEGRIRYLYFVRNASLEVVRNVVDAIRSSSSPSPLIFKDLRAILITDVASNIKSILEIIDVLEESAMPESMTIIKLEHADAIKVANFYKEAAREGEPGQQEMMMRLGRLPQTLSYFPPGVRVIPEPRTNTLILLGSAEANKKIADFIVKELDKQSTSTYRFTNVYQLKYLSALTTAEILKRAVAFKSTSEEAKAGGVRDGDKYFKPMTITAEESGNRLIITADYDSYLKVYEVLQKIDVEQPQVALKILIVNMDITDVKGLGVQLRSKQPGITGLTGENVAFQSSTLGPIVERAGSGAGSGTTRLLGDLVSLATGGALGTTFLTLGSDVWGVYGILKILNTYTNTTITDNPFLIATNNYPAKMKIGETRRVLDATTYSSSFASQNSYREQSANLDITIVPRISVEGYVTLDIRIRDDQFTSPDLTSPNRIEREINTALTVADNQTVVLGGIIRESYTENEYDSFPLLSKIPIIGWLFKSKQATKERTSILVFITPEIIPVSDQVLTNEFTSLQLADAAETLDMTSGKHEKLDPVDRAFFSSVDQGQELLRTFVEREGRYIYPQQKAKREGLLGTGKRLSDFL